MADSPWRHCGGRIGAGCVVVHASQPQQHVGLRAPHWQCCTVSSGALQALRASSGRAGCNSTRRGCCSPLCAREWADWRSAARAGGTICRQSGSGGPRDSLAPCTWCSMSHVTRCIAHCVWGALSVLHCSALSRKQGYSCQGGQCVQKCASKACGCVAGSNVLARRRVDTLLWQLRGHSLMPSSFQHSSRGGRPFGMSSSPVL